MAQSARKPWSAAKIIGVVLFVSLLMTLATLGTLWGIKRGFQAASSNFQFSADAADAHSELSAYYKEHDNRYPTDAIGIRYSKFEYRAAPKGCDNVEVACKGYTITHKDYGRSATNFDYKPAK